MNRYQISYIRSQYGHPVEGVQWGRSDRTTTNRSIVLRQPTSIIIVTNDPVIIVHRPGKVDRDGLIVVQSQEIRIIIIRHRPVHDIIVGVRVTTTNNNHIVIRHGRDRVGMSTTSTRLYHHHCPRQVNHLPDTVPDEVLGILWGVVTVQVLLPYVVVDDPVWVVVLVVADLKPQQTNNPIAIVTATVKR